MENHNEEGQMNIELSPEVADGVYSNLAIINHSSTEFVVDFISIMPGVPKASVKSRIILTPQHAKKLVQALHNNVVRFENQYGEIQDAEQPEQHFNFGPVGEA